MSDGTGWIRASSAARLYGLQLRHLQRLIQDGAVIGDDWRRKGAKQALWMVSEPSLKQWIATRPHVASRAKGQAS